MFSKKLWVSIFCFLTPHLATAGAVITYHGRILDPADRPLEASAVAFKISVYSPLPTRCLLYEETRTISMLDSKGVFVIPIGDGVGVRTAADPAIQMENVFRNDPAVPFTTTNYPNLTCASGSSYTPQAMDQRQMLVSFDDNSGAGPQTLPVMDVTYVPLAVSAHNSQNIGGTPAANVVRVSGGAAAPLTPAYFAELVALAAGTSAVYEKAGNLKGTAVPTLGTGQVLGWNGSAWVGVTALSSYTEVDPTVSAFAKSTMPACTANQVLAPTAGGASFTCVDITAAKVTDFNTAVDARITAQKGVANGLATLDTNTLVPKAQLGTGTADNTKYLRGDGTWAVVSATDTSKLPLAGGTMTGSINMGTQNITNTNSISAARVLIHDLNFSGTVPTTPTEGTLWYDSGVLKYRDSTSTQTLGISSAGSGTVTQVTSANSYLSVATSTTTPALTINVGQVANTLAAGDDSRFTSLASDISGKLGTTLADGSIWVGSSGTNIATARAVSGDATLSNTGVLRVTRLQNLAVDGTTLNGTTDIGKIYKWDGTKFLAAFIGLNDLKTSTGAAQAVACSAGQVVAWSAITDATSCVTIFPSQAANSGKFLTTNGTAVSWADITGTLPAQATHTGKFLTTDGTNATWSAITANGLLPSQATHSGKVLTTDGTNTSWGVFTGLPSQATHAGKVLTTNGTASSWVVGDTLLPTQTANSGKFLTTNGTSSSWATITGTLPTQTTHTGKFLTTDGTNATWSAITADGILPTQTANSGRFLTTNGTTSSWATITGTLPAQATHTGKFLTTDGTNATWSAITANGLLPTQATHSGKVLTTDGTNTSWGVFTGLPSQATHAGKVLTTNGTASSWVVGDTLLPTQTANSGKFLTTNGTSSSWADITGTLPAQATHTGKFLTTDGTNATWSAITANGLLPTQATHSGKVLTTDGTNTSWGVFTGLPTQATHSGKFLTTNGTASSWSAITADGILPSQATHSGKVLTTNGTTATWTAAPTTAAAGSTGQIQYNNSNAFAGSTGLTWDNANSRLTIGGNVVNTMPADGTTLTVNFATGNIQTTTVAAGTLALNNMQIGANYTLILSTTGNFVLAGSGITTWKCSPACASNTIATTGETVVNILKVSATKAYVSWITGF